jgi:hypothetical protein
MGYCWLGDGEWKVKHCLGELRAVTHCIWDIVDGVGRVVCGVVGERSGGN